MAVSLLNSDISIQRQSDVPIERLQLVLERRLVLVPRALDGVGALQHGIGRLQARTPSRNACGPCRKTSISDSQLSMSRLSLLVALRDQRCRVRGIFERLGRALPERRHHAMGGVAEIEHIAVGWRDRAIRAPACAPNGYRRHFDRWCRSASAPARSAARIAACRPRAKHPAFSARARFPPRAESERRRQYKYGRAARGMTAGGWDR